MFPQQPQQQFRTTNANVQFFYRTGQQNGAWIKPPGVSQIYMMLIGPGGDANGSTGGSSGAVTTWWGSAQNVPDSLVVFVGRGNASDTIVYYRGTNGLNTLLTASGAVQDTAGAAMTANQFTASGFFQSVAGQTQPGTSPSATTFLNAGNGVGATASVSQYGYASNNVNNTGGGYFLLQPIIVGTGGGRGTPGGLGCGGGGTNGVGGPGLVIIAAW